MTDIVSRPIHWYPGHMAKAMRQMKEKLNLVDVVIEVLDARCPNASINPSIKEAIKDKPLLLILNKIDLADEKITKAWIKELSKSYMVLVTDSLNGTKNIELISNALDILLKDKIKNAKEKGMNIYPLKAMVVGIPNSGKSTFMNNLAKRKVLEVGNKPGVTKNQQYLKASDKLLLLDNPGVLWPKLENQTQAKILALSGSIKDEILDIDSIVRFGLDILKENYPELLKGRYKLDSLDGDLVDIIARKRGCILKGNEIDYPKAYDIILRDIRSGKIGRISFERPN